MVFISSFQLPPPTVQPSRSSISPLTQNLPELDRLIAYIKASAIPQYMLKHIDKDSNIVWKKGVESIDENIFKKKILEKGEQKMNINSLISGVDPWAKMEEWFTTGF